jgi:DNA repair protein RadC
MRYSGASGIFSGGRPGGISGGIGSGGRTAPVPVAQEKQNGINRAKSPQKGRVFNRGFFVFINYLSAFPASEAKRFFSKKSVFLKRLPPWSRIEDVKGVKKAYSYNPFSGGEVRDSCFFGPPSPRTLPTEERPREKMIKAGPDVLSDQELLAVLLGSGVRGKNVTALAGDLLECLDGENDIPTVEELCGLTGLGRSKACSVAAMLEFGRRKWASGQRVHSPAEIYELIRHHADRRQERFICISLNGAHEVLASRVVTIGLVNRTIVHPREVLSDPLMDRASAIVAAHNHPTGDVHPSGEDNEVTFRIEEAAALLGIHLLDHLIFSETLWFSYRQAGLLRKK